MKNVERIPFNSYPKAIATLKEIFKQTDIKSVALTGGEPFLSERFLEIVLFCRMENKQITIISNGTQGTEKEYKQLLKMGVGLFEFPIHSAQSDIHDRMAQRKDSWKKSVASVQSVLKLGGQVVPVIVITKHNVHEMAETLRFIHSLGCQRIMLNRYNIGGKGCENPWAVSASAEELRQAFATADTLSDELDLRLSSNVCSPICLLNPNDYPNISFGHCSFDVLQRPVTLDINGNIRLCNHSPVVAGNIYQQSLETILYSEYAESWQKTIPEFCANCIEWEKCKGGCRAASEQCFQTLAIEDPIIRKNA